MQDSQQQSKHEHPSELAVAEVGEMSATFTQVSLEAYMQSLGETLPQSEAIALQHMLHPWVHGLHYGVYGLLSGIGAYEVAISKDKPREVLHQGSIIAGGEYSAGVALGRSVPGIFSLQSRLAQAGSIIYQGGRVLASASVAGVAASMSFESTYDVLLDSYALAAGYQLDPLATTYQEQPIVSWVNAFEDHRTSTNQGSSSFQNAVLRMQDRYKILGDCAIAFKNGVVNATRNLAELLTDPYHTLVEPTYRFVHDLQVLSAAQIPEDHVPMISPLTGAGADWAMMGAVIRQNPRMAREAQERMHQRGEHLGHMVSVLMEGSAPQRVELFTELGTSFLMPGAIVKFGHSLASVGRFSTVSRLPGATHVAKLQPFFSLSKKEHRVLGYTSLTAQGLRQRDDIEPGMARKVYQIAAEAEEALADQWSVSQTVNPYGLTEMFRLDEAPGQAIADFDAFYAAEAEGSEGDCRSKDYDFDTPRERIANDITVEMSNAAIGPAGCNPNEFDVPLEQAGQSVGDKPAYSADDVDAELAIVLKLLQENDVDGPCYSTDEEDCASDDEEGFSDDEDGYAVGDGLKSLSKLDNEIQTKLEYIKSVAENNEQNPTWDESARALIRGAQELTTAGVGAMRLLGVGDLEQVKAIGDNALKIIDTGILICADKISELNAFGIITNGVANILDVLGPKPPSTAKLICNFQREIMYQFELLREMIVTRFDDIERHLKQQTMLHLSAIVLQYQQWGLAQERMEQLAEDMLDGFEGTRAHLEKLHEKINQIWLTVSETAIENLNEGLQNKVYDCVARAKKEQDKFCEHANEFETLGVFTALGSRYTEHQFANDVNLKPSAMDYQINTLVKVFNALVTEQHQFIGLAEGAKLVNPNIWVLTALSTLYLTYVQYPQTECENLAYRISTEDIRRLEDFKSAGEQVLGFIEHLQKHSDVIEIQVENQKHSLQTLQDAMLKVVDDEEKKYEHRLKLALAQAKLKAYREQVLLGFSQQQPLCDNPEKQPKIYGNWFKALDRCEGGRHATDWGMGPDDRIRTKLTGEYRQQIQSVFYEQTKVYHSAVIQMDQALSQQSQSQLKIAFLKPLLNSSQPILPLSEAVLESLFNDPELQVFQQYASDGYGYLDLKYQVVNNSFEVHTVFVTNSMLGEENFTVKLDRLAYEPKFYEGSEAIWWWWVGGRYYQSDVAPIGCLNENFGWRNSVTQEVHIFTVEINPKPHVLTTQLTIPNLEPTPGTKDQYQVTSTDYPDDQHTALKTLLEQQKLTRQQQVIKSIVRTMRDEAGTPLNAAMQAVDQSYKNLRMLIAFMYRDIVSDEGNPLYQWFYQYAGISSLQAINKRLDAFVLAPDTDLSHSSAKQCVTEIFSVALGESMSEFTQCVKRAAEINAGKPCFSAVELVVAVLKNTIKKYQPYAVNYNFWYQEPKTKQLVSDTDNTIMANTILGFVAHTITTNTRESIGPFIQFMMQPYVKIMTDLAPDQQDVVRETKFKPLFNQIRLGITGDYDRQAHEEVSRVLGCFFALPAPQNTQAAQEHSQPAL